jgi:hypothetical protein
MGTHDIFSDLQTPSLWDNMLEELVYSGGSTEILNISSFSGDNTDWTEVGASPYLDYQDEPTNYIYTSGDGDIHDIWGFDNPQFSSSQYNATLYFYCKNDDGAEDDYFEVYTFNFLTPVYIGDIKPDTSYSYYTLYAGQFSGLELNGFSMRLVYQKSGGADDVYVDHCYINATRLGLGAYRLDLEMGWTNADYDETNEEVCVYANDLDIEALVDTFSLDVWNDSGNEWVTVIADIEDGWNNASVSSFLVDSTLEIRIVDSYQTSDLQRDWINIDVILLHTWTPPITPVISWDNLSIYYNPLIVEFYEIIEINVYTTVGYITNVSLEILGENYSMLNIFDDTFRLNNWTTSYTGIFDYTIHMFDNNTIYNYVSGEIAVYDPQTLTLGILGFILLFALLFIELLLYLKLDTRLIIKFPLIATIFLFGLVINVSSLSLQLPATPYLQILLIFFETVVFFITSLEYYKIKKGA